MVVVASLATHVDHPVDTGASAQRFAARIKDLPAIESFVRLGAELPVRARIVDAIQIADGDMNPHVVVATARFDQKNIPGLVSTQTIREQAAGGTGANNNKVKCRTFHLHPIYPRERFPTLPA